MSAAWVEPLWHDPAGSLEIYAPTQVDHARAQTQMTAREIVDVCHARRSTGWHAKANQWRQTARAPLGAEPISRPRPNSGASKGTGTVQIRQTFVTHGRLAMREIRLQAARDRSHGVQAMTFEQLAARLAGGFARPIDSDTLRGAVQTALVDTDLGELDGIK